MQHLCSSYNSLCVNTFAATVPSRAPYLSEFFSLLAIGHKLRALSEVTTRDDAQNFPGYKIHNLY